jgi:tRNA pseudouridine55 synthase
MAGRVRHSAFGIQVDGLLVINKPSGKSSHDIVYAIRRLTGEKRVGHAGTLDPMATGVLIICLGRAVRVSEYLIDHDKTYRARVRLGVETDTYDATGRIVATSERDTSTDDVRDALNSFVGKILQRPPAHSAIQRGGVRAYKLARRGIALELEPREVEIYSIDLREMGNREVEFDVRCSKGTFIRSLAHDLGQKLGTGAHLTALTRLAIGQFTLETSVTLGELEASAARAELDRYLLPIDRALLGFDALRLDNAEARGVRQGRFVPMPDDIKTSLVRAYDEQGSLVAVLEKAGGNMLKPKKVFSVDD